MNTRRAILLAALPVTLFLLAINPWFSPEQHDDVTYFFGAKSIAESGKFAIDGVPITDWPPVFPAFLAAARWVVGGSPIVAKLVVLAFVIGGVFAIRRVASEQRFANPTLIAALTCLLPISLICGANILSEWPFITLSFLFLIALRQLDTSRAGAWTFAAGALLAAAALTRFSGVLLGVAIVAQAITRWRSARRLRAVAPELGVALIGATPWLLWKLRCQSVIAHGDAPPGAYDQAGYYFERFSNFDLASLFSKLELTVLSATRAAGKLTESPAVSATIICLLATALVAGAVIHFRSHGIQPADWYVLANLALLLGDLNKPERYFLVIAPFLIGYLLVALRALAGKLGPQWAKPAFRAAIVLWVATLVTLDGYLLFRGNADGSRGGQSLLASPDITRFYRGEHLELYQAIRFADSAAPAGETIGAAGFHGKYLVALAGRSFQQFPEGDLRSVHWMIRRPSSVTSDEPAPDGWQLVESFGTHRVFRRLPQ